MQQTMNSGRTCWITAGSMPLRTATVLEIYNDGALVQLHEPQPLPVECDLYFTFNCTVGRKCCVTHRTSQTVRLSFLEKIGSPIAAQNDNIVEV
jgi:hypothetical protein